jgi:hypothetical protein
VLMQMVHVFNHAALARAAHAHVVNHRNVLNIFTKPHAARMAKSEDRPPSSTQTLFGPARLIATRLMRSTADGFGVERTRARPALPSRGPFSSPALPTKPTALSLAQPLVR